MEFSRQEYWSGWPFPFPGDLCYPGIEPWSPALQADSLCLSYQGSQTSLRKASATAKESLQNRFPDPSHQLWEKGSETAAYDLILSSYLGELPVVYAEGKLLVLTHRLS